MKTAPKLGIRFFLCGFLFLTSFNISAQQWRALTPEGTPAELAFIYYARGRDFSHTLRGQQTIFSADVIRMGSVILDRTGIVQTGAGTSLEIQLVPSGTVIKLSENTTLVYNGIDANGGFADIGLLFGRIRVVSGEADPAGFHPVIVRSGGISARIVEGDMGIDYVLEPSDRGMTLAPLFRINAFRGRAEVFSHGAGGGALAETQSFTVEQWESLSLDVTPTHTFVERMSLTEGILAYWMANNFAGNPPLRMPDTAIALPPAAAPQEIIREVIVEVFVPPAFQPPPPTPAPPPRPEMGVWGRRFLLGVGLGMIGTSMAVQGLAHYAPGFFPNEGMADNMHAFAYAPLITGALFTLIGTRGAFAR